MGSIGGKGKIVGRGGICDAFKHKMDYQEKARNLERLVNQTIPRIYLRNKGDVSGYNPEHLEREEHSPHVNWMGR